MCMGKVKTWDEAVKSLENGGPSKKKLHKFYLKGNQVIQVVHVNVELLFWQSEAKISKRWVLIWWSVIWLNSSFIF